MLFKKIIVITYLVITFHYIPLYVGPLHDAVKDGNIEKVIQLLASMTYNIEAQDEYGNMPLHIAAENGQKEVVELQDNDGWTPSDIAELSGHQAIVDCLAQTTQLKIPLDSSAKIVKTLTKPSSQVAESSPTPISHKPSSNPSSTESLATKPDASVVTKNALQSHGITIDPNDVQELKAFQKQLEAAQLDVTALQTSASFVTQ